MKILFLTQILPYPLDAGAKTRAYYVLRHLAQKHEVTLVSFVRATDTPEAIAHLSQFCQAIHTVPIARSQWRNVKDMLWSLLTNRPFLMVRDQVPAMNALLTQLVQSQRFDAIHADQLWMAPYALTAQAASPQNHKPITVLDQHNAVYMIPQRMASGNGNPILRQILRLEAQKLARYEIEVCTQVDRVVWVTQDDYDAVQRVATLNGNVPVRNSGIIPICNDADPSEAVTRNANPKRVTFVGGLHYHPNAEGVLWFAQQVFPSVLEAVPDARLTVIGKNPPAALLECNIPATNLEVTGYVKDPLPYLADTAAFIVPIRAGGGMRVKIIDGWKWGVPIVSTTIGAEGIQITPTQDILIADTPTDFSNKTIALLQNNAMGQTLIKTAHATLNRDYHWQSVYRQWDSVYSDHRP